MAQGDLHGRNLSSALMRSRVHNRNRDRGGEPVWLALGPMEKDYLILRRASASRPSGEWNDDDYDVLADGEAVGRIFNANAAPAESPWMWSSRTTKAARQPMAMSRHAKQP